MKIEADRDVCIGAGMCVMNAEEVFDQGDDGIVVVLRSRCRRSTPTPPRGRWRPARRAPCAGSTADHVLGALLPCARGEPVR